MRLTTDQIDKLCDLKGRYTDCDVVELYIPMAMPPGYISFLLEDGDERLLLEGCVTPTGEVHT